MDNTADRATDETGIELGSTIDNKDGSLNDDGHQYEGAQKDDESQPFIQAGNGMVERLGFIDRKSTRLNSSHVKRSRMPSSA